MSSKVYWPGRHATRPELGTPLSRVHSAGLTLLKSLAWEQVANDTQAIPVFAFTTRKGAKYPADQPNLPTVRQLPHANTATLDDKRQMQQHLHAADQSHLLPPSWHSVEDFLVWLSQQSSAASPPCKDVQNKRHSSEGGSPSRAAATSSLSPVYDGSSIAAGLPAACGNSDHNSNSSTIDSCSIDLPGGRYFVKHRLGVKGQAVYHVQTHQQLDMLLQKLGRSRRDFIVQQEVPPLLLEGRKFVMRVHVLITCSPAKWYMHEDVIVLKHAAEYSPQSTAVAAHVSSKGSGHPKPILLTVLPQLHGQVMPQLQQLVASSIAAVEARLMPVCIHPAAVLYHLFGYDCMVNAAGRVVLLEVNSYPAIASGTMAHVDAGVYTRLVGDMVRLLVLPHTDGVEADPGGFVMLK